MPTPAKAAAPSGPAVPHIASGDASARRGDVSGALKAYRAALAADPRSVPAHRRLLRVYAEIRAPEKGLEVAQRLIALAPRDAHALASAGDHLEALGRLDEAHAKLLPAVRAGARDPYLVTVFGRICERMEPARTEALPLLERLAADAAAAPRWRVKALWCLVHTLDRLDRFDEAFAHAQRLKGLEAGAGVGRPPHGIQRLDDTIAAYTRERMARLPRATHGSRLPIFVLGMLRSGTTLAEQILSAHPAVHGAGELPDIAMLAVRGMTRQRPYPECLDRLDAAGMNALAQPYLDKLRKLAPQAQRVTDKMPTNFEHLGMIECLFPQAAVIHCVREPLDTCLSLYYLPDTSRTETLEAVGHSYNRYLAIMERWRGILRIPVLTLRYEELVADPERKVRELLDFCGLPWDDACLAFHRSGRYSGNFSNHQVRRPLYARSVGRHQHYGARLDPLRAVLARKGPAPDGPNKLAITSRLLEERQFERAAAMAREALGDGAPAPTAYFMLAQACAGMGEPALAIDRYAQAIEADPAFAQAYNNRGNLLTGAGRTDEAVASLRRAIELKPDYALAHYNLGNAHKRAERTAEAIACYERALALRPDYPDALNNFGNALKDAERPADAIAALRRALELRPDFPEALHNLAGMMHSEGNIEESIRLFRAALALAPKMKDASFGLALSLLLVGRYEEAWEFHEARWGWSEFPGRKEQLPGPQWRGERFDGKTLLVYFEQGMGDTMQFVRYLPMVAARGGKVVLEVQRALLRLCAADFGRWAQVIPAGAKRPPYDLQCALQSLPLAFGTTYDTIPREVPYFHADPALAAAWRERIGSHMSAPGLKVGLVWAGNPKQKSEVKRGVGMAPCLALFGTPGVRWFSLQVGDRTADLAMAPPGAIIDLSPHLTDFAETAAAIANLDLVITTDTSVAHLSGGLGAPTWLMTRKIPDWRWELEGDGCRWYPTMRQFRQPTEGDWPAVTAAIRTALEQRAAGRG